MRGTPTGCGVYEFDQAGASMLFARFAGSSGDKEPGGDEGEKEDKKVEMIQEVKKVGR